MHGVISTLEMFTKIMNLGMTVMTGCNSVGSSCLHNLIEFYFAVSTAVFREPGLEETTPAAATKIIRSVGNHVNEIFLADNRFYNKTQIFGNRITETLAYQLARILNRELNLQVLIPIGVDRQFAFPDPLGIILNDTLDFKAVLNVEFLQSGPECE